MFRVLHDGVEQPDTTVDKPSLQALELQSERPLGWLWQDTIPLGKLTLIEGPPAVGKLFVALDIAALESCGVEFGEDDSIYRDGQPVVVIDNLEHYGRLEPETIYHDGREQGFSEKTLIAARDDLGARSFKVGFGETGSWLWTLKPESEVSEADIQNALAGTPQELASNSLPDHLEPLTLDSSPASGEGSIPIGPQREDEQEATGPEFAQTGCHEDAADAAQKSEDFGVLSKHGREMGLAAALGMGWVVLNGFQDAALSEVSRLPLHFAAALPATETAEQDHLDGEVAREDAGTFGNLHHRWWRGFVTCASTCSSSLSGERRARQVENLPHGSVGTCPPEFAWTEVHPACRRPIVTLSCRGRYSGILQSLTRLVMTNNRQGRPTAGGQRPRGAADVRSIRADDLVCNTTPATSCGR